MQINKLMSQEAKSVQPSENLANVARIMQSQNIGLLPVEEEGRILGVITDRDIVTRGLAQGKDPQSMSVREAMTSPATCCHEGDSIESAADQMKKGHFRRLPVLDKQDKLVGVLSLDDIAQRGSAKLAGETLAKVMEASEPNLALA
ncbi:CBS domain-containing protein [Sphingomicrobium lutaoense]|uniref:CBS domain-containing protein n=1 Tax=Sphingomicrobium lutaoense TaxID=515949 RepID=A0A839Z2Z4_9SPHN|nr:CBS domain-containing protein [Sphingomicrobium lutaoense]MBB3764918.1 CBS domain-containing protein [Sphingomicrobium lutaoense]